MKKSLIYLITTGLSAQVVLGQDYEKNLKTCLTGKYESLCNENNLTSLQRKQIEVARTEVSKRRRSSSSFGGVSRSSTLMNMGGGDKMNLSTGEYIMDLGGGDQMNLSTGDYIMDMGGGDKMNLGTGDYIMNMGGGVMMNLSTGEYTITY